jgi:hypothetical protein
MSIAAMAATASMGAMGAVGLAGPASAATLSIKCKALSGNDTSTTTLSLCSGNTGGSSKPLPAATLAAGGVIKWVNGLKTKLSAPTLTAGSLCPAGTSIDDVATGTVLSDTTHSVTLHSAYKLEVCVDGSGNVTLAPGTKAKI